jgi:hypothetical protein
VRIAVIVSSSYSQCQKVTELSSAEADVDVLCQRLSEPDAGFVVHSFRAERGLPDAVDRILSEATEPVDEFLFYFSGYAVLNDERGPALLLDGERLSAFSLKRLHRVLSERARSSLAVIDAVPAFDGQISPHDAVRAIAAALADPASGVHLLAASRPESQAFGRSPFSSLFELVLDWQSVSGSPVRAEGLYAAMVAENSLFSEVAAAEYFPGVAPFDLLKPVAVPPWTDPPPAAPGPSPALDRVPEAPPAPSLEALMPPNLDEATPVATPAKRSVPPPLPQSRPSGAPPPPPLPAARPSVPADPATPTPVARPEAAQDAPPRGEAPPAAPASMSVVPATVQALGPAPTAPSSPEGQRAIALERLTESLANGRHADALGDARIALRFASRNADVFRKLHLIFEKLGRPDGAWNASCVLEALGAADVNESLAASLHRPEGLIAAKNVLDDFEWKKRQLYAERDPALDALLYALGPASVEVGVETARRKRRMPLLDPATEQDPTKSTTTLARTLVWTARLFGLPTPKLYIVDDASGELTIAPTAEPVVLASKSLGSGLGLPDLAFLWARRLVLFRPEHRIATFLLEPAELTDFVKGAQVLGAGSEKAFKRLDGDAKLFARGLKRHLRGAERGPLEAAASRIVRESIPALVNAYRRSLELAAARAGLLACGDLSLALRMTERFPQRGMLAPDEQSADLFVYSVSDEYAALRERLGVAVSG